MRVSVTVIGLGRPLRQRRKPTLREIATAVQMLQLAEGAMLHANRDGCFMHGIAAANARRMFIKDIPKRLRKDSEWMHQHVEAPGMRIQARADDEVHS